MALSRENGRPRRTGFLRAEGLFHSPLFILGTERSGSTWLANILDAAPSTVLFMEPFCAPVAMLPEFPEAAVFVGKSDQILSHFLRSEMPLRLFGNKTFLFRRSISDPNYFRLERLVVALAKRSRLRLVRDKIRNFELLNLNRLDSSSKLYHKNPLPDQAIVKELRLAGKIPLLLSAFPDARFVVIVRHPCATVHSILRWFTKGRLSELRRTMGTYLERIEAQSVGRMYAGEIDACRKGTLAHLVGLYWRISYETIASNLNSRKFATIVAYEELAARPPEVTRRIFQETGIPWASSVDDYLEYSTSNAVKNPGVITTVRESRAHYKAWQAEISDETREAVLEVTNGSALMPMFAPFYNS